MPKNTKKRTKVKELPRPKQELTAKAAKNVKGGFVAVEHDLAPAKPPTLGSTNRNTDFKENF